MVGRIKFLDGKTKQWGFIIPEDGSQDVHFSVADFVDSLPVDGDADERVSFELEESGSRRSAKEIRFTSPRNTSAGGHAGLAPSPTAGEELKAWAYVPFIPFRAKDGKEYSSVLDLLAELALKERWHFGENPDARNPYPILDNYLTYTFAKLRKEDKVLEGPSIDSGWATFNTGLVDRLYDPIFALFEKNRTGKTAWYFHDFCVPGKRASGRRLTSVFDPLPETAKYFNTSYDLLFDTSKEIHVDYEHVILDGVERDRFPPQFLREHLPEGFDWQDVSRMGKLDLKAFLLRLRNAVEADARCMRAIKRRLEDAKLLAEKRIRWNFKTAIPQYYPKFDTMSLLLPLALINDELVDIALVVTRNPSGSYQGRTILPLDWAYMNARLVCRPDSDWLLPERVQNRAAEEISVDDEGAGADSVMT